MSAITGVGLETDGDSKTKALLDELGSRSVLAVPVLAGDVIVAVIAVHELVEARTWLPAEIDLVQVMADELGSAVRHAQLYEAERTMVEQLRELDEVKSDFVSSVSHELRTPLTSVMGYLEMLRDREAGPLTQEQDRMLDIVERNTERLLALIEDLLALARIESGRFKVVPAPLELPPLVDAAIDAIRPELAKRQLKLLIDVPPGLPLVLGDGRQLERVLLNLLSNAVKFTPPGGQIRVTLAPRVRSVVLEVADTGLGIPVEEQDKLFTRFFRSSTSQLHSVPGTGLGLMIVKAVVDSHGGTIDVRSAAGFGTAVTVTLPAVPASARLEELRGERARRASEPSTQGCVRRAANDYWCASMGTESVSAQARMAPDEPDEPRPILVVEDDDDVRDLLSRRLTHLGHEVLTAGSGEEALELAGESPPTLVVLDIRLPGIDGWEFLRRLRASPERRARGCSWSRCSTRPTTIPRSTATSSSRSASPASTGSSPGSSAVSGSGRVKFRVRPTRASLRRSDVTMSRPAATVIVADDDPDIRELVSFKLESAGYPVHAVGDGDAALAAADDAGPRSDPARRDDARHQRLRRVPPASSGGGHRRHPGDHAHRPGPGGRRRDRVRGGGRGLHRQTVQPQGAAHSGEQRPGPHHLVSR